MGIGTSLGAYYETDFDHHTGLQYLDDNVADLNGPRQLTQDQNEKDPDIIMYNNLLKEGSTKPIYKNNFKEADEAMQLTDQERNLYRMHLYNLEKGGVRGEDGSTSTLLQQTFEFDSGTKNARTYNIPSVYNGKVHSPGESIAMAQKLGLDNFPNYSSTADANGRYDKMHEYMEQDTMNYEMAIRGLEKQL